MIVVGLDLSLRCSGIAIGDELTRVQSGTTSGVRETRDRIYYCAARISLLLPPKGDDVLAVVEAPSFATPKERRGLEHERAALWWITVDQLYRREFDVVTVTPKQRAKLATGNGNAKKPEVKAAMRAAHPGLWIADDNVADAVALRDAGLRHLGRLPSAVPWDKKQDEAMRAVRWPERGEQ